MITLRVHPNHTILPSVVVGAAVLVLLLSGCRTYGGHGSEEATFEQIQQANFVFTERLTRVQRDVDRLRQTAADVEDLQPFVERYEEALLLHQGMLSEHMRFQEIADRNRGSHRTLHRLFAAIIVDHQRMQDLHNRLLRDVEAAVIPEDEIVLAITPRDRGDYQITPPFYHRLQRAEVEQTLGDVLARVGGTQ